MIAGEVGDQISRSRKKKLFSVSCSHEVLFGRRVLDAAHPSGTSDIGSSDQPGADQAGFGLGMY
jgi:hypothetical protein